MQPLPHLETCLRLCWEARDADHPCGVSLASYFARAPTRGRRQQELAPELLFPEPLRSELGDAAIAAALDAGHYRSCRGPRATVPVATREWLAEAALALGRAEGYALMWALLRAMSELELAAQRIVGTKTPRAVMRQVLHGIGPRGLRVEPFAAFLVRVLKIAQTVYAAARTAGALHEAAWGRVQDRLWSAYPTGKRGPSGGIARGAYLPSLVQAASGHARKRARRSEDERRTRAHVNALLARFVSGEGHALWPWTDGAGAPLPDPGLAPETAAVCFFVLLTRVAGERRARGGPSGGLSEPFVSAGFAGGEWLPDRTDDLAIRLLAAPGAPAEGGVLDAFTTLVRATLDPRANGVATTLRSAGIDLSKREAEPMLARARERLPGLLRWLEENGRELLETT